jgi:Pin2-interacting protein X1
MSSSNTNNNATNAASVSLLHLCGRKHKSKMGSNLNEAVATGPNEFARKQLEKLGWTEGTGLGKNRDGRASHIRVQKRTEEQGGIGASGANIDPIVTGDQWWKSSVGNTLARLAASKKASKKDKKKKKSSKKLKKKDSKKKKRDSDDDDDDDDDDRNKRSNKKRKLIYTDEELFKATGGARFGMRAQTQQKGKWGRAEKNLSKDEKEIARKQTEWDGMSVPKIILS